jgi:hypothetical protein
MCSPSQANVVYAKAAIRLPDGQILRAIPNLTCTNFCAMQQLPNYLSHVIGCSLVIQDSFSQPVRNIMSKAQDSKKEAKKPAAKTAKEKQEAKKAKKAENARKEF